MTPNEETRRTGMCGRASEMSLGRDKPEDIASTTTIQAAWLSARFNMGAARARVVAELAFAKGHMR